MEFEPGTGVLERSRIDPANAFPSPRFTRHEARALQYTQVFGHRRERKRKWLGETADGGFSLRQTIKDGTAGGVGQRVEDKIEVLFNHVVECMRFRKDAQPFG